MFPKTSQFDSGRRTTRLEVAFYAMPKYIAKSTAKHKAAVIATDTYAVKIIDENAADFDYVKKSIANVKNFASAREATAEIAGFVYEFLTARLVHLKAQIDTWYLSHTDMPFDANVKIGMARTLAAIAVKKGSITKLSLEQQEQIDRVFARELVSTIIAAIYTAIKEPLTFLLFAWIYYLIVKPTYWLLYKNIIKNLIFNYDLTPQEQNAIKHVKDKTFSDYWRYGIALPNYRFFHKLIFGIFELIYGLGCFVKEKEIAKKLPEKFSSGMDNLTESIGSSTTIGDSENSITASKRPLLTAFNSFSLSMRGMLFTPRTMIFNRQRSSDSSIEASPIAQKRKSAFAFEMNEGSSRPHSVSL